MGTQLTKRAGKLAVDLRDKEFLAMVRYLAESGFDAWLRTDPKTEQIIEHALVDMLELLNERISVEG